MCVILRLLLGLPSSLLNEYYRILFTGMLPFTIRLYHSRWIVNNTKGLSVTVRYSLLVRAISFTLTDRTVVGFYFFLVARAQALQIQLAARNITITKSCEAKKYHDQYNTNQLASL